MDVQRKLPSSNGQSTREHGLTFLLWPSIWYYIGLTLFWHFLLGSLKHRCFKIKFQNLPATPCSFWLWPEGADGDTLSASPAWEEFPELDTPWEQLVPSWAPVLLLVLPLEEDAPGPHRVDWDGAGSLHLQAGWGIGRPSGLLRWLLVLLKPLIFSLLQPCGVKRLTFHRHLRTWGGSTLWLLRLVEGEGFIVMVQTQPWVP